jgi:hypothetical protein
MRQARFVRACLFWALWISVDDGGEIPAVNNAAVS